MNINLSFNLESSIRIILRDQHTVSEQWYYYYIDITYFSQYMELVA